MFILKALIYINKATNILIALIKVNLLMEWPN